MFGMNGAFPNLFRCQSITQTDDHMKSGYKVVYFGDNISICDKIKHKCEEIFRDMINKTLSKQSYNHL